MTARRRRLDAVEHDRSAAFAALQHACNRPITLRCFNTPQSAELRLPTTRIRSRSGCGNHLDRQDVKRILIIRSSAIGDIVLASPIAHCLRRAYPDAHIAWLVEPGLEALVADDPDVDEVVTWPKSEWVRLARSGRLLALARVATAFGRTLRQRRFDTVLDLQGLLKSGVLARLSGASTRIALGGYEGSRWLMTQVIPKKGLPLRISAEYRHLAERLALPAGDFVPQLHLAPQAVTDALTRLRALDVDTQAYAVLAPFTTRPQKHWREDGWQSVALRLRDELGLQPILLGGPADSSAAARIATGNSEIIDLTGRTTLRESAAIVSRATVVIGVDTGLTHMGIGFDRPTVSIFGSTRPYLDPVRTNVRPIWLGLACSPCRRRPTCGGAFTCMADITPERVMQEVAVLLGDSTRERTHPRHAISIPDPATLRSLRCQTAI